MSETLHVAVGVISYKRPAGLEKLLQQVALQKPAERPFRITMLVVDNDEAGSARPVTEKIPQSDTFKIAYAIEPRLGIPIARNKVLDIIPADADWFCFLDDDEYPSETWLQELLRAQAATGADCIHAVVVPLYEDPSAEWIVKSRFFDGPQRQDLQPIPDAATNNVLVSVPFLKRASLRFDERLRKSGGEDYMFFRQAMALGMKAHWSTKAVVYETVPANRTTARWVIQRNYRQGNTFAVVDRFIGKPGALVKRAMVGGARMGLGAALLPTMAVSPFWGMRSVVHLVKGAGMIAGVLGQNFEEYAPERLQRDRKKA